MKKIVSLIIKNAFVLSMILLAISIGVTTIGTLFPYHEFYYLALLCIITSCILLLFKSSLVLHSKKAFVLSLFNLFFIAAMIIETIVEGHIVLASTDWHLGTAIILLYIIEAALYLRFFRNTISGLPAVPVIIFVLLPVFAACMFYGGIKAWISLIGMALLYVASALSLCSGFLSK